MRKNIKGFTLIELLAVIVIMGILMLAAIPAISNAIARSRRDTFASNAKEIISSARTALSSEDLINTSDNSLCQFPPSGQYTAIQLSQNAITYLLERGGSKSSFGQSYSPASSLDTVAGYVFIENIGTADKSNYVYSITLVDQGKNGIDVATKENEISRAQVKTSNAGAAGTTPGTSATLYATCKVNP